MINFNKDSVFNLKPIPETEVRQDIRALMIQGEMIVASFKTIRDQLVFTNKRIIAVDVQGLTGTRKSFSILPYSKIQFFQIQTPGLLELVPDSELHIMFSNGFTAHFEFKGNVNIGELGRVISEFVL